MKTFLLLLGSLAGMWVVSFLANAQGISKVYDQYGDHLPEGGFVRLGTLRLRHTFEVDAIAVSPDKQLAATTSSVGFVRVWELASGRDLPQFKGKIPAAGGLAFSNDGEKLFAASSGGVRVYDTLTGKVLQEFKVTLGDRNTPISLLSFQFSPRGKWLGIYGLNYSTGFGFPQLKIIDLVNGKEVFSETAGFFSYAFSPDDQKVILGSGGWATVRIPGKKIEEGFKVFELPSGKRVTAFQGAKEWSHHVMLGQDGWYTTVRRDSGTDLVNVSSKKVVLRIRLPNSNMWAFSPKDSTVAITDNQTIRIVDLKTGKVVRELVGHRDHFIRSMAFSPDGSLFLAGGRGGTVVCWDLRTGKELHNFEGHRGHVASLAFSPDGKTLASGGEHDGYVYLWDWKKGIAKSKFTIDYSSTISLAFSSDGRFLAAGDGYRSATGGSHEAQIYVWDLSKRNLCKQFVAHLDGIISMSFSKDGKSLASAGRDCRVRVWDWSKARRLNQIRLPQESSFVRISGPNLIFEKGDEITTWQLQPFQESKDVGLPEKRDIWAAACKTGKIVSPDGKLSLRKARGESFPMELWDEVAEKLICIKKEGNFGNFTAFAFSPDSRILAAGTREGSISLYDTESLRGK